MSAKEIAGTAANATARTVGGVLRLVLRGVMTVFMVLVLTTLFFGCIFAYYVKTELNPKLTVALEDFSLSLSSTIWYTDSEGLDHELKTLTSQENRIWVDYENLPEGMEHALVAIEDRRFYEHRGVDWYRTAGAVVQMFFSMSNDFGGSTITQQLIKNRTENNADLVSRKLLEIFQALELEKTYEKSEIIEWYLNVVYFGEGSYGVYTAAQKYFGKDVWDLTLAESASIIGITNNPSKYDPFIANTITDRELGLTLTCREWNKYRQELILQQMYEQGYITYSEYKAAVNEELNFVRTENESSSQEVNSFYVELVVDDVIRDLMNEFGYNRKAAADRLYYGGLQIYCSMDPDMQAIVDNYYQNPSNLPKPYLASRQQLQSGMMILDPYTGDIKAMAGAVGEKTDPDAWNYTTDARRQVGSSIKPLSVYGPALEYGLITQNTRVNDSANIRLQGTSWYTRNSPNQYSGVITIRYALQESKNTVAAQIVDKLTPIESYRYLQDKLGFVNLEEADADYAPMAEGALTIGVTVREMAQAYTSFVNEGIMTYARSYTKILDSNGRVVIDNTPKTIASFSPNTAANMCDMLQNAVENGTGKGAGFPGMAVAGKTGTTGENYDRYFVGFTPYYVAAVWTGYDLNETMNFSPNPAVTIWHTIMQRVHEGLEQRSFPKPEVGEATNIFGYGGVNVGTVSGSSGGYTGPSSTVVSDAPYVDPTETDDPNATVTTEQPISDPGTASTSPPEYTADPGTPNQGGELPIETQTITTPTPTEIIEPPVVSAEPQIPNPPVETPVVPDTPVEVTEPPVVATEPPAPATDPPVVTVEPIVVTDPPAVQEPVTPAEPVIPIEPVAPSIDNSGNGIIDWTPPDAVDDYVGGED